MKRTANWKPLDVSGKCGSCRHYQQKIVRQQATARGLCTLKGNLYKMRTESCKKHIEKIGG